MHYQNFHGYSSTIHIKANLKSSYLHFNQSPFFSIAKSISIKPLLNAFQGFDSLWSIITGSQSGPATISGADIIPDREELDVRNGGGLTGIGIPHILVCGIWTKTFAANQETSTSTQK